MKTFKLIGWLKAHRLGVMVGLLCAAVVAAGIMLWADHTCAEAARGRVFSALDQVPVREVGVVLGSSKFTIHGKPNPHFDHRIQAAAAMYRAGKVRHLLVSGDNHIASYDEPDDMRMALIAAGVPANVMTCDYAGFRTLDSVVRAEKIFGLSQYTIITEAYHCPRALWIAQQHGLDAIAFAAPDVSGRSWAIRAKIREQFARTWCAVDLYLLHRSPKFLGPKEPILLTQR